MGGGPAPPSTGTRWWGRRIGAAALADRAAHALEYREAFWATGPLGVAVVMLGGVARVVGRRPPSGWAIEPR